MELKEGAIRHIQEYVTLKLNERGFQDESLHERLLLLSEEIGELVHASRERLGMNVDELDIGPSKAGEELADALNMVFSVAVKLNIDLEKEFLAKEVIVDQKTYSRPEEK